MNQELYQLDLFALQAIFIQKNRAFTEAMRKNRSHKDLVALYNDIQEVYAIMMEKKEEMMAVPA